VRPVDESILNVDDARQEPRELVGDEAASETMGLGGGSVAIAVPLRFTTASTPKTSVAAGLGSPSGSALRVGSSA
jgi:hypothetical protein